MAITQEDIAHVAHLARLHMEPEELAAMREHFERILGHFARLGEIDTEGVEPTYHPLAMVNVLRDDRVAEGLERSAALRNAPKADEECFLVPLIMEDE